MGSEPEKPEQKPDNAEVSAKASPEVVGQTYAEREGLVDQTKLDMEATKQRYKENQTSRTTEILGGRPQFYDSEQASEQLAFQQAHQGDLRERQSDFIKHLPGMLHEAGIDGHKLAASLKAHASRLKEFGLDPGDDKKMKSLADSSANPFKELTENKRADLAREFRQTLADAHITEKNLAELTRNILAKYPDLIPQSGRVRGGVGAGKVASSGEGQPPLLADAGLMVSDVPIGSDPKGLVADLDVAQKVALTGGVMATVAGMFMQSAGYTAGALFLPEIAAVGGFLLVGGLVAEVVSTVAEKIGEEIGKKMYGQAESPGPRDTGEEFREEPQGKIGS